MPPKGKSLCPKVLRKVYREVDPPFHIHHAGPVLKKSWYCYRRTCILDDLKIAHQARSNPSIWVVALVPIDTVLVSLRYGLIARGLLTRSCVQRCVGALPRSHRGPRCVFRQRNQLLSISSDAVDKSMIHTSVSRVECIGLETLMLGKRGTGPFPESTHVRLTREFVTVGCNSNWMPVFEAYVGTPEVGEELFRAPTILQSS